MDIDPNKLATFIALVIKHEKMLVGASHMLYGQSLLLEASLARCYVCDKAPFTVRHRKIGMGVCERCAAEKTVAGATNETDWVDIELADEIRRLVDYVDMIHTIEPIVIIH